MGPISADAVSVQTSIQVGTKPWSTRTIWVPRHHLSRSMQSIHNRGMSIQDITASNPPSHQISETATTQRPEAQKKSTKRGDRRRRS